MCDLQVVNWALEAWLIPDVVQVKCEKELRFPGDPSYEEADNKTDPYHYTTVTLKTPACVCGEELPHYCACAIWEDLGSHDVQGEWALSALGSLEVSNVRQYKARDDLTEVEYFWYQQ